MEGSGLLLLYQKDKQQKGEGNLKNLFYPLGKEPHACKYVCMCVCVNSWNQLVCDGMTLANSTGPPCEVASQNHQCHHLS